MALACTSHMLPLSPQILHNRYAVIFQCREENTALIVKNHRLIYLVPNQAPQEPVFFPQRSVILTQAHCIGKSRLNALRSGCDQYHIQPQLYGRRVGDHIAQDDLRSLFLQLAQGLFHLFLSLDGMDMDLLLHQLTQLSGAGRYAGKSHNGVVI